MLEWRLRWINYFVLVFFNGIEFVFFQDSCENLAQCTVYECFHGQ